MSEQQDSKQKAVKRTQINSNNRKNKIFHKSEFVFAFYKAFRRLVQASLVVVIIAIIATAILWLRLQAGPINLDFAKDKIEQTINNQAFGYKVKFDQANLIWPNVKRPLLVEVRNLKIFQKEREVTDIKNIQIGFSPIEFAKGRIRPKFIKLVRPEILLVEEQGKITICCLIDEINVQNEKEILVSKKTVDLKYIRQNLQRIMSDILNDTLEGEFKNFQSLQEIEMEDALVFLKKENQKKQKLGNLNINFEEQKQSITLKLNGSIASRSDAKQKINAMIVYRGQQKDLTFTSNLSNIRSSFWNQFLQEDNFFKKYDYNLSGRVQAAFDKKFKLSTAKIDAVLPSAKIIYGANDENAIDIQDIIINAYYNRQKETLNINEFKGNIGNIPITINALGMVKKGQILLPINLSVVETKMQNINNLIPQKLGQSSGFSWLKSKLIGGSIKDLNTSFTIDITRNLETKKRQTKMNNLSANFLFDDMKIIYSDTLLPVTDASGSATIKDDVLTVRANTARIEDIQSDNVVFTMKDLTKRGSGSAELEIDANAPIKSVLSYLKNEPISIKNFGFDTQKVQGNTKANVLIRFPTTGDIKAKDFDVEVNAILNEVLIPNIVQNLPLSEGPFNLKYSNQNLELKGEGLLASWPITIDWNQNFKTDQILLNANITADEGLRRAFGVDLERYISGTIPIKLIYSDIKNIQKFDLEGDLEKVLITIDAVNYKKPVDVVGKLSLKGLLKDNKLSEIDALSITAKDFSLSDGRILFRNNAQGKSEIYRGSLQNINLKDNKLSAEFETTPTDELKIILNANIIDANPYFKNDKTTKVNVSQTTSRPLKLSIAADKMILKNDIIANNVKIYYETNKMGSVNQAEMDAIMEGGNTVFRFKPALSSSGKTIFLEAANAGAFLKAADIYKNIDKGSLFVEGQSTDQNNQILVGKARIDNFKAKDAPILAQLINTLSIPGLLGLMNNEGLTFSRLESDFEWRFREKGDLLIVKEGRSSGASLGLTFEGIVNRENQTIDISGNAIPMSEVNSLIGEIPIIGDILTGGDALLAATYTVEGQTSNPVITVNPLAALAPGFLRKILFEEDVEKKIKDAE